MQLSSVLLHHTARGARSKDTWLIAVDTTSVELMFFGNKSFLRSWKGDGVYNLNDESAFGDIPLGILYASRASGKLFTAKFLTSGGHNGVSIDFAKSSQGSCCEDVHLLVGSDPFGLQ